MERKSGKDNADIADCPQHPTNDLQKDSSAEKHF
jgi:hypothetical protein